MKNSKKPIKLFPVGEKAEELEQSTESLIDPTTNEKIFLPPMKQIPIQTMKNLNIQKSVEKSFILDAILKLVEVGFQYDGIDDQNHGLIYGNNESQKNALIKYKYDHKFTDTELHGIVLEENWTEESLY